ncbi:ATP-binding protein [Nitrosomonas sp. sh817]|uniref:ATP-binding protein n=1 Tax=Nitrosomonas sp. sh817 TaxID=3070658 RepID=UPI0027DB1981|nr:ATP-binding protein [Nitrosomonas sp. sh817]WMJ10142.1 ATP-binding protein [Nitrosomonas sp. sh817]
MIKRHLEDKIRSALATNSSVALMGPRQVGKTTLAINIANTIPSVYLDLENRIDLQKAQDIEAFHKENSDKLIILDEVQRLPDIFAPIRGLIDQQRRKGNRVGQFLFLGSASIDLLKQSSETLAGRISYIEMFPVNVLEYTKSAQHSETINDLWLKGGFPDSLLASNDETSLNWRYDFIRTYLERDIPQLGPRIPAETLGRFWTMLAHSQGTNINASKLASNIEVSSVTVARYIDLLVDLLLIRKIQPYTANIKKRLVKSPRIYVRDSGITHALLNIGSYNDLLGHPVVGKSWEGFVIENIASVLPPRVRSYYYRTAGGAEIDLVLEFGVNERWAIEIKKGTSLSLGRGFHEACEDIKPQKKFVIYAGKDRFPLPHDITAIAIYDFMDILKGKRE